MGRPAYNASAARPRTPLARKKGRGRCEHGWLYSAVELYVTCLYRAATDVFIAELKRASGPACPGRRP